MAAPAAARKTSPAQQTSEANQRALQTASQIQLTVLQELNGRLETVLTKMEALHDTLQADKELIESDIATRESQIKRMDTQIEVMIKLHNEMRQYYEEIKRNQR